MEPEYESISLRIHKPNSIIQSVNGGKQKAEVNKGVKAFKGIRGYWNKSQYKNLRR